MALTTQALVLAIVYVLSVVIGLIMTIKAGAFNAAAFVGVLVTLAFIALLVYDTQCLTVGNCTTWSWVRTVLYVFFPALSLIVGAFALFQGKQMQAPVLTTPSLPNVPFKLSEEYVNSPHQFAMHRS
jgi:protein-S-isoprenylcysteine O-methyltransferase Ste14